MLQFAVLRHSVFVALYRSGLIVNQMRQETLMFLTQQLSRRYSCVKMLHTLLKKAHRTHCRIWIKLNQLPVILHWNSVLDLLF
jgi:hypothetical protein